MFKSLNSNTGESVKKTNTECQMKDVYKCINDVEERVNANCACEQSLQNQINTINNATTIVKDEGQFNNLYSNHLNVNCPITAPGTTGNFSVNGQLNANGVTATSGNIGNLTVNGNTCLKGTTTIDCLASVCTPTATIDCLNSTCITAADKITANVVCACSCLTTPTVKTTNATINELDVSGKTNTNNLEVDQCACIFSACIKNACIPSGSFDCNCSEDSTIEILRNSKSIGNRCISIPIEDDTDFYRYQLPREFSGEVHLWNCDYSININTTNCHRNAMIIYSATNADTIRGFYRNNYDNRFYLELCSTQPIYYDYRAAQPSVFNFEDPLLICAMTDAGATYAPDCTYYCVTPTLGSHVVIMNDNQIPQGLTVCGSLRATYLEFECAYFPGGLVLDQLCVNGPTHLDGCVYVGENCSDAVMCVNTTLDANYLNVHCTTCLGDRLVGETRYILSIEWKFEQEYYTYDDVTGEYTYYGTMEYEDWEPNKYYIREELAASCVKVLANSNICGPTVINGEITQQSGNLTQCCGCYQNICDCNSVVLTPTCAIICCCANSDCYCVTKIGPDCTTIVCNTIDANGCQDWQSITLNKSGVVLDCCKTLGGNACVNSVWNCDGISQTDYTNGVCSNVSAGQVCLADCDGCCSVLTSKGLRTPSQVIGGDLTVCGNIYQCGTAYETHAEQLYTTKDCVCLRDGATAGLSSGCYSGIEVIKYDGTNNTAITTDNTGIWCVGTSAGAMQPLATRSPHNAMCDKGLVYWCAACKCLYTQEALCCDSNIVYYDAHNHKLYTGSPNMVNACPIYWCASCKCFVTGPACHETWLCGLGPVELGTCVITDPNTGVTTEYCTIDVPSAVTAWTLTSGVQTLNCCVKIINITRECFDALAVKDDCAYYMICDEWSGGLSLNNFCAGQNIVLTRDANANLVITATSSTVLGGICGGNYISVTQNPGGTITIDSCAIDTSCFCAGNGMTMACVGDEITFATKVCTLTQAAYDAATKINDYLYFTIDTKKIYYGTCLFNDQVPIGTVQMFYGNIAPNSDWLPMDGSAIPAGYDCLCAFLGSDHMPDMREAAAVMIGCRAGETEHDCYSIGTYKSDALRYHNHNLNNTLDLSDPGHTHTVNDPGHSHAVNDPGHTHGTTENTHTHVIDVSTMSVNDPGHTHVVSDSGHCHCLVTASTITVPNHTHEINDPGHTHTTSAGGTLVVPNHTHEIYDPGHCHSVCINDAAAGYDKTPIVAAGTGPLDYTVVTPTVGCDKYIVSCTTGISVCADGGFTCAVSTTGSAASCTTGISVCTGGGGDYSVNVNGTTCACTTGIVNCSAVTGITLSGDASICPAITGLTVNSCTTGLAVCSASTEITNCSNTTGITLTGDVTINPTGEANVNHGRRFGLLYIMKAR